MRDWYDNYRFSKDATDTVFNPDAVLYFMQVAILTKKLPDRLIDDNLRVDYSKLQFLVYQSKQLNGNFTILSKLSNDGFIISEVLPSFPSQQIIKEKNYISLLYFFGLLTHCGKYTDEGSILTIPNKTISVLVFGYILDIMESTIGLKYSALALDKKISDMASKGDFKPFFSFTADVIDSHTSIRDYMSNQPYEYAVKMLYIAYINIYDYFISKSEIELNKGYADLVLVPNNSKYKFITCLKYGYLIEFKYIKIDLNKTEYARELDTKIKEATTKLCKYEADDDLKRIFGLPPFGDIELVKVVVVFKGWEMVYCEKV
jgi:hypothetical protein